MGGRRMGSVDLGASQGDLTLDVKQVLDRIRHPGQGPQHLTTRPLRVHGGGLMACPWVGFAGEGVDGTVGEFNTGDASFGCLASADVTPANGLGQLMALQLRNVNCYTIHSDVPI